MKQTGLVDGENVTAIDIGCKHIDIDYFAGVTKIADKKFTEKD